MPFSIYKAKEKVQVKEDDKILWQCARDPSIRPTHLDMQIILEKDLEFWYDHDLIHM